MKDRFVVKVTVVLGEVSDTWGAAVNAWGEAQQVFQGAAGSSDVAYDGLGDGNKRFSRGSLEELRNVLDTHGVDPKLLFLWHHADKEINEDLTLLSGTVSFISKEVTVEMKVTGSSRLAVELIAARMAGRLNESKRLRRVAPEASVEVTPAEASSSDNGDTEQKVSRGKAPVQEVRTAPAAIQRMKQWILRQMRQHTGYFFVTVAAGLAILLLAGWLGIQ